MEEQSGENIINLEEPAASSRKSRKKLIIALLVFLILISLGGGVFYLFKLSLVKPSLVLVNLTDDENQFIHDKEYKVEFSVDYVPTKFDNIILFFNKKHSEKFSSHCELFINNATSNSIKNLADGSRHEFALSSLSTGSYDWKIECKNNMHGGVEKEIGDSFTKIIPLMARDIKSIRTSNFQMALLAFYHNLSPDTKIIYDGGYVKENEFLSKEIALYGLDFGNSDPEFYHKNFFEESGQVSVKVRSEWKPWHESGQIMEIVTDEKTVNVFLPNVVNPTGESLFYIADDGSTYFGKSDHYQHHNEYRIDIDLTWDQALSPEHLASAAGDAPDWSQIPQEKTNPTKTNDEIDQYIKNKNKLINNQPETEDAAQVSLRTVLLEKADFTSKYPSAKSISIDTDSEIDNWINHENMPKAVEAHFQFIRIIEDQYPGIVLHVRYDKFNDRGPIDTIIRNSFYQGKEKTIDRNAYCTLSEEGEYVLDHTYRRQCGFTFDTVYIRAYYEAKESLDEFVLSFLQTVYDNVLLEASVKNNEIIDTDKDGLSDEEERAYGTDPLSADTDGDGYSDFDEINNGYNPLGEGLLSDVDAKEPSCETGNGDFEPQCCFSDVLYSYSDNSGIPVSDGPFQYIDGELLIYFNDGVDQDEITALVKKYNGEIIGCVLVFFQVRFSGDLRNIKEEINNESIVSIATNNGVPDIPGYIPGY